MKKEIKKWKAEEILLLFSGLSNEELAERMKRNEMSVRMARESKISEILEWAKENGKKLPINVKLIKEFLGEK